MINMTEEQARHEINLRIDRETQYVLALAKSTSAEAGDLLRQKIENNNETIRLLGKFLELNYDDKWEKFYRKEYWEARMESKTLDETGTAGPRIP